MDNLYPYSATRSALADRLFMTKVYGWMTAALAITGVAAVFTVTSEGMKELVLGNRGVFYGLIIAELLMVVGLSAAINRISAATAAIVFVIYSVLNGLTLSVIFLIYTSSSIASTFFVTAGVFGAMTVYGFTTRRDLTSIGNLCFMALIGLIIASIVNLFIANTMLYWITTYAGVLIFVGLIAYDTQKLKNMAISDSDAMTETGRKAAIVGALALYLDFVNLMLMLLRILGRRR